MPECCRCTPARAGALQKPSFVTDQHAIPIFEVPDDGAADIDTHIVDSCWCQPSRTRCILSGATSPACSASVHPSSAPSPRPGQHILPNPGPRLGTREPTRDPHAHRSNSAATRLTTTCLCKTVGYLKQRRHPAFLYFKRAKADQLAFGAPERMVPGSPSWSACREPPGDHAVRAGPVCRAPSAVRSTGTDAGAVGDRLAEVVATTRIDAEELAQGQPVADQR